MPGAKSGHGGPLTSIYASKKAYERTVKRINARRKRLGIRKKEAKYPTKQIVTNVTIVNIGLDGKQIVK